jgi:FkbM family methyltransferase
VSQIAERLGYTDGGPRFAGVKLSGPDPVSAWGISRQIAGGEYDYPGLVPQARDRVIDIGANIGVYALWAARRGAKVIAYEPGPATFPHLEINVAGKEITPVHAAVVGRASAEGTVPLYLHDERSTRNTLVGQEIGTGTPLGRRTDVPAAAIDEVLAEGCDMLKVDCEGGEFEIFDGVSDAALQRVKRIVLEFHRTVGDPQALIDRLTRAGFEASIVAGEDTAEPFGVIGARAVAAESG